MVVAPGGAGEVEGPAVLRDGLGVGPGSGLTPSGLTPRLGRLAPGGLVALYEN